MSKTTATPVEVGQVRLDPDPRTEGKRAVRVERVDGALCCVVNAIGRHSRIATKALARWPVVTP